MQQDAGSADVLDLLAGYAPVEQLAAEWSAGRASETLVRILGTGASSATSAGARGPELPLHFLPVPTRHRRRTSLLPIAAAVVVLAMIAGIVVALAGSTGQGSGPAGGTVGVPFDPPTGLSDAALADGHLYYQIDEQLDLGAGGTAKSDGPDAMVNRNYVTPGGDITSMRTGSQSGCHLFPAPDQPSFSQPDRAFFAGMPTDVSALTTYLRTHVEGSSSHNEAVFVAVGDSLRTAGGLASPRIRAALLAVISRTPGVVVHLDQRDQLGRPAIRADFVDQKIRPNEVHAYYFDPTSFAFLEERFAANGQPAKYTGPSPAYDAAAGPGEDPVELTGAGFADVITSATVLDHLPTLPADCRRG